MTRLKDLLLTKIKPTMKCTTLFTQVEKYQERCSVGTLSSMYSLVVQLAQLLQWS